MDRRLRGASALLLSTCLTAPLVAMAATDSTDTSAPAAQVAQAAPAQVAQTTPNVRENILEEVVVTSSRKREENVQSTPIAVTALNSQILERAHVTNFSEIGSLAPNLHIETSLGASGLANIYLRGFGQQTNNLGTDPHVAVFVDGIYQPSPVGALFDTFDIGQIEVLAGPQGTLLGKNAPIGAITVSNVKPTGEFGGVVEGDYGSYNHVGGRARIDFPIWTDASGRSVLAGRASFVEKEGGNWVYNVANGKRDMGGENSKIAKLALAFTPDSPFEWDVYASAAVDNNPQHGEHPTNFFPAYAGTSSSALQSASLPCLFTTAVTPGNPPQGCEKLPYGTTDSTFTSHSKDNSTNASSNMSYRFNPVTLTSLTGYAGWWQNDNLDDAGTPFVALNAYNDRTEYDFESEELRLASNKDGGWDMDGHLDWVVGGYFSNFSYYTSQHLGLGVLQGFPQYAGPIAAVDQASIGRTQSEALFGHFIYNFTDQWTGTFGVRQTWDHKINDYQATQTGAWQYNIPAGFHNISFEAGTAYQFDDSRMAYIRFSQGYESGGFADYAISNPYNSELNNAYEIGLKSDWLDKRLRVNVDFFINELSQLQLESALAVPTSVNPSGFLQETLNAGSATVEGMEAQILGQPTDDLTLHMTLGYLRTKFNQNSSTTCSNTAAAADCSGLPFAYSPKWTMNLGGDYVLDLPNEWGTATIAADWDYRSTSYTEDPVYPSSRQEGYALVNLGVTFRDPSEKYSLEFFGTNILDRHYMTGFTDPTGLAMWEQQGTPAEWGMRLTYKFGKD